MWIQVTTTRGDRSTSACGLIEMSPTNWLAQFKRQRFMRVELHLTVVEFKRAATHAWIKSQVLPRLSRGHAELRIEVKR